MAKKKDPVTKWTKWEWFWIGIAAMVLGFGVFPILSQHIPDAAMFISRPWREGVTIKQHQELYSKIMTNKCGWVDDVDSWSLDCEYISRFPTKDEVQKMIDEHEHEELTNTIEIYDFEVDNTSEFIIDLTECTPSTCADDR